MSKTTVTILENVQRALCSARAFSGADTVIVGVSGGPDSLALLHALSVLRHKAGLSLHVAHFNHGWRNSADADERFVCQLAKKWGLPCSCARAKGGVPATAMEERARAQRLQFFARLAKKTGASAILLAHTQDDLVETVLMHIIRGSGLQGMRGLLAHRRIAGVDLIRPLLNVPKKDILTYLKDHGLRYRRDPTNLRSSFLRNRIRLELLPFLEKRYNPGVRGLLANLADTAGTDYEYLEEQARKVFGRTARFAARGKAVRFERKGFARQSAAVQRMLIRLALERLQGNMNRLTLTHMREIEDAFSRASVEATVHLPGHVRVRVAKNYLEMRATGLLSKQKT